MRVAGFFAGGALPDRARGTNYDEAAFLPDLAATLLDVGGAADGVPDGASLWPALRDGAAPTARAEPRIVHVADPADPLSECVVFWRENATTTWKLLRGRQLYDGYYPPCTSSPCPRSPAADPLAALYLFDVANDPTESDNLAHRRPDVVAALDAAARAAPAAAPPPRRTTHETTARGGGAVLHVFTLFQLKPYANQTPTHGLYTLYLYRGAAFWLAHEDARVRRALCA